MKYTIEVTTEIITAIGGAITVFIPAYFTYRSAKMKHEKEMTELKSEIEKDRRIYKHEEYKINFFNEIMNLSTYTKIKLGADDIFKQTKADRFLILIAVNGKDAFNTISVVMEHHDKESESTAIGKYHNIKVDNHYKHMLREAERRPAVNLEVSKMPKDALLRDFYEMEGVTYSKVMFLARRALDNDNDMLVFCSVATHNEKPFTRREKVIIQSTIQSQVASNIKKLIEE